MGWGAAQAFYEQNSSWLDGPDDAYEALYGQEDSEKRNDSKCPLCGKKKKGKRGVMQHLHDYHDNKKGRAALAEMGEMPPADPPRKKGSLL